MASKYIDTTAIIQVIGCVYNNPQLLDFTDKYTITEEDFPDDFHKIAFGAIYKLYELGTKKITLENISDFLSSRPKSEAIFKQHKGEEWLLKISELSMESAFDYYYNRLKKFSLLRAYDNHGIDVSELYDPDKMPKDLLEAHHSLDMVIESCYRRKPFENDEQRLAHLFKMYEMMTNNASEDELKQLELGV